MSKAFVEALGANKLVFAGNMNAQKTHIVQLRGQSAYEIDLGELLNSRKHQFKTKEARDKAIAKIDLDRKTLYSATALCGVTGEHAMYGHYTRYYWRCVENPTLDGACKGCQREWKKMGSPVIVGFNPDAGDVNEPWPWPLPFGWNETQINQPRHPYDVDRDGDPELVKSDTGKVKGEYREEVRRFQRGVRIVRLVFHPDTETFSARYWDTSYDVNSESWEMRGALVDARRTCHKLMAQGGG